MPPPTAAPKPIRRLDSLGKPGARPKPLPRAKPKRKDCCEDPKIENEDGMQVCVNCGTQISESNIVSDVTFSEDTRGAAMVQGGFIGENARHARTLGAGAYRRVGGGERNTIQEIETNGKRILGRLCPRLNIPEAVSLQAQNLFCIAAGNNFNAGRRTEEVVAACLYAACRRQKQNTILLMDIAEIMKVNVFRLGEVYKAMKDNLHYHDQHVGVQHLTDVEPLIDKYCRKLEFGDKTRSVAEDAIKIIRRMKRDWMVTGRHPAGLCGACIILAARMNNFRRSVREVVYVAKVSDVTIAKRVEEFRRTKASTLSVEQFREFGTRLKFQHDPPVLAASSLQKEKFEAKKRKRQEYNTERETMARERETIEISDDEDEASDRSPSATPEQHTATEEGPDHKRQRKGGPPTKPVAAQEPRIDADGFAIPALPATTQALISGNGVAVPTKKRVGRPRKTERPEPMQVTEADLEVERELEDEIDEALSSEDIQASRSEIEQAKFEERAIELADKQRQLNADSAKQRRTAEGVTWWPDNGNTFGDAGADMNLEAEFADDPEVRNCMLSDAEARIKEQIWLTHNEDWLRGQHEKALIKQIAEAAGANKDKKKGKGGRKKKGRMGDGTVITEAETPIETPADANAAMLAKRAVANFSKFVDYERLAAVYGDRSTPGSSASQSRAGSVAPSVHGSQAPSRAGSEVPSAQAGADRDSATPAPQRRVAIGLPSPQVTQQASASANAPISPSHGDEADVRAPASPPQTQDQATAGAENEDMDVVDDDDDYRSPTPEPMGWDDMGSDREDIGEDDYGRAIDEAAFGSFGGDEEEFA